MLDFRTGAGAADDSGYNQADSVRPPVNGENVNETVMARHIEHLRTRSEAIRTAWDLGEMTAYHDRGLVIAPTAAVTTGGGPTCTWGGTVGGGGTGQPTLSASILVKSAGSPAAHQIPEVRHTTPIGGQTLTLTSSKWTGIQEDRSMAEGGYNVFLEFRLGSVGVPLAAALEGAADPADGPAAIVVTYEDDGLGNCASTYNQLVNAIMLIPGNTNGEIMLAALSAPDANLMDSAFVTEMSTRHRLFEFATYGVGGVDSISYSVSQINVQAEGPYAEGDMCVLNLDGQLERLDPGASNYVLRIADGVHNNIGTGAVIPLFLVKDDTLIWFNGVVCPKEVPTELITQSGLRAELANTDSTSALGLCGSVRVGSEDLVSGALGTSIVAGTIYSQLFSLYQLSTAGAVVVDPVAGQGHFQTIAAAVSALSSIGGTILVNPGTYTGAVSIGAASKGVTIIGRDPETCILQVAGAVPLTISTTAQCRIMNLSIVRNNFTGAAIDNTPATPSTTVVQQFLNCRVYRTGVPASATYLVSTRAPISFERCYFLGTDSRYETAVYIPHASSPRADVWLHDNKFNSVNKLVTTSSGGGVNVAERLEVTGNEIYSCGHSSIETHLIYFPSDTVDEVLISNNRWSESVDAAYRSPFCKVYPLKSARIENNVLLRSPTTALSIDQSVIDVRNNGPDYKVQCAIRNNTIGGAGGSSNIDCGGIYTLGVQAHIEDNSILAGHSRAGDAAIEFTAGVARANKITASSSTSGAVYIRTGTVANHVVVADNDIYGTLTSAQYAIRIASVVASGVVRGNRIQSLTAGSTATGIEVGGSSCQVCDNTITTLQYGIKVIASQDVILRGNKIVMSAAASAYGIRWDSCVDGAIDSNLIYTAADPDTDSLGIFVTSAENVVISNNRITTPLIGISVGTSPRCSISGNFIYAKGGGAVSGYGVQLTNADYCTVYGNRIYCEMPGGTDSADCVGISTDASTTVADIVGNYVWTDHANASSADDTAIIVRGSNGVVNSNTVNPTGGAGRSYSILFLGSSATRNACIGNRCMLGGIPSESGGAVENGIGTGAPPYDFTYNNY